jgi:exopolysaccharide biosynthesis polyprenyl glycosylphosphotransferase
MLRERAKILGRSLAFFDLMTVAGLYLAATLFLHPESPWSVVLLSPWFLAVPLVFLAALHGFGLYRSFRVSALLEETVLMARAVAVAGAALLAAFWLIQRSLPARADFLLFLVGVFLALCIERLGLRTMLRVARSQGYNLRYFLIVGSGLRAREICEELSLQAYWGIRVRGQVSTGGKEETSSPLVEIVGHLNELENILERHVVDGVFFVVEEISPPDFQAALECCRRLGIEAMVDLHPLEEMRGYLRLSEFAHSPLLIIGQNRLDGHRAILKRSFDLLISSGALLMASPLMLMIALLIKLSSPGGVLFRQQRVGMNGRRFTMFKFRTMVDGAEGLRGGMAEQNEMDGPVFKMRNDPRITRLGHYLRRLSLDELPQLCNVVAGHMSLVGPRPPLLREVEQYQSWQRRRLSVRPGLTCLWQVSGRNDLSFERWMKLDLDYIDNWSWWLDLKILWRTLPAMVRGQ